MIFLRRWRATAARIVHLTAKAAPRLAQLHAAGFARSWSESDIESMMAARGVRVLGAKLGSAILGMVMVRVAADEAEILSVAVDPEWRGCGLGRRLLDHALDEAAGDLARRCFLEVEASNEPATALYRGIGFTEIGRRAGYYADEGGGDALVMARRLDDRVPRFRPPDAVEIGPARE